ncbi:MAG: Ger(x)C family spore germination protein [Thermacetogeniaceae bacterium]
MKRIVALILLFSLCLGLTGCYDKKEIDDLAYVLALGIDKGKTNTLKVTLQYAVPSKLGGGGGGLGGGGGGSQVTSIITVEANSITDALSMANNFLSRRLDLSHSEIAVFSEELAREGQIAPYMNLMNRSNEFRPSMTIAVSRGPAEDYLKGIKPVLDLVPSKYYELSSSSYKYTGLTINSQFLDFYSQLESNAIQPVAVLVAASKDKSSTDDQAGGSQKNDKSGGSTKEAQAQAPQQNEQPGASTAEAKGRSKPLGGDYLAGDIPKTGGGASEAEGLAVFDGPKMVGELDGEGAMDYLLATGAFHSANIPFQDPRNKELLVLLTVRQRQKPQRRVEISGGKPKIYLQIALEADILAIQSGYNYETPQNLPILEQASASYFQQTIQQFLSSTAQEAHADICGFGQEARGCFLTWKDWEDYKWLQQYKDATFDVSVSMTIRRPGLMLRSEPYTSSGGESQP